MTRTPSPPQNKPTGPYANNTEIHYHGRRDSRGRAQVYMEPPGQPAQVFNPPADYEWGYAGIGPARLAWALLYQHGGSAARAEEHQYEFKEQVISRLPREGWTIASHQIERWLRNQEAQSLPEELLPAQMPIQAMPAAPAAKAALPYRPAA